MAAYLKKQDVLLYTHNDDHTKGDRIDLKEILNFFLDLILCFLS